MKRERRAFTLVELLVVMAIIGVLMALMTNAFYTAREHARKTRAKAEVNQLAMAWGAYLNDYREWRSGVEPSSITVMDDPRMRILRGNHQAANPRRVMYMEFDSKSIQGGVFLDPWGTPYEVRLDDNLDNEIQTGLPHPHQVVYRNVAAWSKGRQNGAGGAEDDFSDDIRSWEE